MIKGLDSVACQYIYWLEVYKGNITPPTIDLFDNITIVTPRVKSSNIDNFLSKKDKGLFTQAAAKYNSNKKVFDSMSSYTDMFVAQYFFVLIFLERNTDKYLPWVSVEEMYNKIEKAKHSSTFPIMSVYNITNTYNHYIACNTFKEFVNDLFLFEQDNQVDIKLVYFLFTEVLSEFYDDSFIDDTLTLEQLDILDKSEIIHNILFKNSNLYSLKTVSLEYNWGNKILDEGWV